jgi:hypothetical protein
MAADLGGSQISALLESVPGIRNVLRSPVADALVNTIRAAVGLRPFAPADAEELVQYAVRRGLINQSEGDQVLEDVRAKGAGRPPRETGGGRRPAAPKKAPGRKPTGKKPAGAKPARKPAAKPARRPVKKR